MCPWQALGRECPSILAPAPGSGGQKPPHLEARSAEQAGCVAPGFSHRARETWVCSRGDTVEGMTAGVTKWQRYGGGLGGTGFVTNWRAFLCPSFPELSSEGFSPD